MRLSRYMVALPLVVLAAALAGCGRGPAPSEGKREVRVAAAADLKFALDDLLVDFHREHPDIRVQVSYGSSGNFFAQLSNKAPFDIFFSADVEYPRRLVEQGLAAREDEFLYAVGHLVVWVPRESSLDLDQRGIRALLDAGVRKVAIANPRHAPYGRAAEAALKKLGVYDEIKSKIVQGDNVAQAAQFVQTGAADAGVIALSLALSPPMRQKGRYWEVPLDAYPRLTQGGIILSWAQDRHAAETLRDFVGSPEGKAVLRRFGFFLPEK
jgi:molybdate transport system substrate-binding protein